MAANTIPLTLQTTYAELLERTASAAFEEAFSEEGTFTPKKIRGRRYWYFQVKTESGRQQRYVGAETPELLDRIRRHKKTRDNLRERQTLVSTLVRSARLPRPNDNIGAIVEALARAGVFRLRGVLVGTVAYQTYSAMLGIRLASAHVQTEDVDVAQFSEVSVAVEDQIPPILDVLRKVDESFREVLHTHDARHAATYEASDGMRVDFLTPNRGEDTDEPRQLPALGTHAQPLRFLDFLIRDPEPAVLLIKAGIYVVVPAPQRFALHKLIVGRRRRVGTAKAGKDFKQAEVLLDALVEKRPSELRDAWDEAFKRGPKWRQLLGEGLGQIDSEIRDKTLRAVDAPRSTISGLDLRFPSRVARYDFERDTVTFIGEAGGAPVRCSVSREALDDYFGIRQLHKEGRLEKFRENRDKFEDMARQKYLRWPVEEPGSILIKTREIPKLLKELDR